ncbi:diiron oxygenase [Actinomadura sp. DC4]|uniref:diiron oxygenase n=1 Tax=Actinomadura sp. DC4 TaxID=3055069 RepID=UPI0025AF182F|nr:diiron oxygenase [Actinomadura sp. DC4]MDN3358612.1 diiron oxygenase [Actinomadura sp. DC4]
MDPWIYSSRFGNWENRASVRNKPPRILAEASPATVFFPPEAVPAVSDPLVAERGPAVAHRLLVHALYQYLHFTTVLEQVAVLPVTANISLDRSGVPGLPAAMRADAFKITTDEAWHAQSSHDFTERVVAVTGVAADAVVEPRFAHLLARLRDGFDPADRPLVDLVFAVVSETLVSSLLADLPFDRRLPEPVRALVADHAADEGRHHSYFRAFLRYLWPRLTAAQRRLIGPRVPELVEVFLHPDLAAVRSALTASGFTAAEAETVVRRSYDRRSPIFDIAPAARATIRAFHEVDALEDPATRDAFLAAGLG